MSVSLHQANYTVFADETLRCGPISIVVYRNSSDTNKYRGTFGHSTGSAGPPDAQPMRFCLGAGTRMMRFVRELLNRRVWRHKRLSQSSLRSGRTLDWRHQTYPHQPSRQSNLDWPRRQVSHLALSRCSDPSECRDMQSSLGRTSVADRSAPTRVRGGMWLVKSRKDGLGCVIDANASRFRVRLPSNQVS